MASSSSYPVYRYPHATAAATSNGGGRGDLAMLLAPLPTLLLPPRPPAMHHDHHQPHQSPHNHTPNRGRRGNCTIAMLLGDDSHSAADARCRYPSKLCRNTRVRKASGALHRYCAYHRNKANANQKRWVDRQRHETSAGCSPSSSSSSSVSPPASPGTQARAKFRWILAAASTQTPMLSRENSRGALRARDEPRQEEPEGDRASAATLGDDDWDALLSLLSPKTASDE